MSSNEKARDGLFRELFSEQLEIVAVEAKITAQPLGHVSGFEAARVGLGYEDKARRRFQLGASMARHHRRRFRFRILRGAARARLARSFRHVLPVARQRL